MYERPHEHLLAELRRLDLILLSHLANLGPASDAAKAELEEVAAALAGREPVEDVEAALRRQVEAVRHELRASLARGVRLPIVELCRALELDAPSLGVLLLACAPHFDRKYAHAFAYLQGHRAATTPRVDLALDLFGGDITQRFELRRAFQATSPLLRDGFVRLGGTDDDATMSLLDRPLLASARLVRHLAGHDEPDAAVAAMTPVGPLVEATRAEAEALTRFSHLWRTDQRPGPIAVIVGEDSEGIITAAAALASERRVPFVAVDLARPGAAAVAIESRVREPFREAALRGALLCVVGLPRLVEGEREVGTRELAAAVERFAGSCILLGDLSGRLHHELRRRPVLELRPEPPDTDERRALWRRALTGAERSVVAEVDELAWRYRLGAAEIRDAARMADADAQSRDGKRAALLPAALGRACRARSRRDLETLAQAVEPRGAWADLILPESSLRQLRELVQHIEHHDLVFGTWGLRTKVLTGDGVPALFVGPPGTGKTMASALLAREIGRELFRIDLAGVVSKYIGETEKNLEKIFAVAHRSNAVLLFDEADALFGKRTEVKDAHDRYANVETSYLLQRIEQFDGLVILATNFKKNVDEAFLRRMAVIVDFPMPDLAQRKRLWEALMPAAMPREADIDLEFLARQFEISGGYIKNAIQSAAMAAADGVPPIVGFHHLLLAIRQELRKLGRVGDLADFGRYRGLIEGQLGNSRTGSEGGDGRGERV